jgi:hypothetical protein
MELKEFIANTLSEIQEGVQMAIDKTIKGSVPGAINPNFKSSNRDRSLVQNISFDIAVTVADEEKAGISGGIKVVGLSLGGQDNVSSSTSRVSRIQFSIPVIPPVTNVSE